MMEKLRAPLEENLLLVDRYRIRQMLGEGGMSRVYLAEDLRVHAKVAVKENLQTDATAHQQFEREARLLAQLTHPHIPRVLDNFGDPSTGLQYLVMEYVSGDDLETLRGNLPVAEAKALKWIREIANALEYLHSRTPSVIHRDVKPGNIKIDAEQRAILVDFGIAKIQATDAATLTVMRHVTPGFAPPEQYSGHTTERSDIYALGATLYTLLTGRTPPVATTRNSKEKLISPRQIAPENVSPATDRTIMRAMEMQADKRWQSVTEFVAALDVRDLSQSQPPARVRQNFLATPWQFAFIGAAVVGILVAAVIAGKFITGEPKVAQEVLATQSVPTVFRTPLPQLTSIAPSRVPLIIIVTATPTLTPTPTRTPTPTPTPSFYSATLSESLRLDILPEGAQTFSGHCVDTVGKIDGNARLVLAEIDSDVARGVVKLKVLIAIPKANYANGMISPNTTAYSTIDSNPIGRIRLENCFNQTEWPAELVGNDPKDPSKINVVVEGWVQERTLRSQR